MIPRGLVLIAFVCCALVLASFAMFARDQIANASARQQTEIATGRLPGQLAPGTGAPVATVHHGQPRRFIDDAARTLTSPFRSIVSSDSAWVTHSVPTIFALLVYGLGLGFLARYSRGLA